MNWQSIKKIKTIFLDYNGRMSREAFAAAYGSPYIIANSILSFSSLLETSFLWVLLLTTSLLNLILICVVIKRFHDLNLPGWCCIVTFIPLLHFLLIFYLILKKGNLKINKYGEPPLPFKGQSFVLFCSYVFVGLQVLLLLLLVVLFIIFLLFANIVSRSAPIL